MVKLQIYYKSADGKKFQRILRYINPSASNSDLKNFVDELNKLTTNEVTEIFKIINRYLDDEPVYSDDTFISAQDLSQIFNGTFKPAFDDDPISTSDFGLILSGTFQPVADDDSLSASDFIF